MSLNVFFTWWNKQTFGTFLKTLFTGKYVGHDQFGNKYYKNKRNERWVIYSSNVEATKITTDWYLWMHHTTDIIPNEDDITFRVIFNADYDEWTRYCSGSGCDEPTYTRQ